MIADYRKFMHPHWLESEKLLEERTKDPLFSPYDDDILRYAMIPESGVWGQMSISCGMMAWYEANSHQKFSSFNSIVEVGGGFGHFCRVTRSMFSGDYTIIDIPVISRIQNKLVGNFANCVGIDRMDEVGECDFFVSIFALNETSPDMLKYVIDKKLFGAKHWYIYGGKDEWGGFHGLSEYADKIGGNVTVDGIFIKLWK